MRLFLFLILFENPIYGGGLDIPPSTGLDLQKIPVIARKDAQDFQNQIRSFLEDDTFKTNAYACYFQGVIFGEAFQMLSAIEMQQPLERALASLSEPTPECSRDYFLLGNLLLSPSVFGPTQERSEQRTEFQKKFKRLEELFTIKNAYALFIQGFLSYDEGFDREREGSSLREAGLRSIILAASYNILPAVGFIKWYEQGRYGRASDQTEKLFVSLQTMQGDLFDPYPFISLFIRDRLHKGKAFLCYPLCLENNIRDTPRNYVNRLKESLFLSFSLQDKDYYEKMLDTLIQKYWEDPTRRTGTRFLIAQILAPLMTFSVSLYSSLVFSSPTENSLAGYINWFLSSGAAVALLSASTFLDNLFSWLGRVAFAGLDYKEEIKPEFRIIALFYTLSPKQSEISAPEHAQDIFEFFYRPIPEEWIHEAPRIESCLRCLRLQKPTLSQQVLIYEEKHGQN